MVGVVAGQLAGAQGVVSLDCPTEQLFGRSTNCSGCHVYMCNCVFVNAFTIQKIILCGAMYLNEKKEIKYQVKIS